MNKQQSEAPSPWRPRQRRESPPLQGPPRGCRARAPELSSARCAAEGAQVSTGQASATRATAAADRAPGQRRSRSSWRLGAAPVAVQPGERGSPGRARCAPCAPARTRFPGAGGTGAAPGAWGEACRPRRTGLSPRSSPASRLHTSERAFCAGGACRAGCFCVGFSFFSPSPLSLTAVVEKFPQTKICSF